MNDRRLSSCEPERAPLNSNIREVVVWRRQLFHVMNLALRLYSQVEWTGKGLLMPSKFLRQQEDR